MGLRDTSVGASCVHMAVRGGHKGNYRIFLYHMVSEVPKPSWNNGKISGDRSQYGNQTENRRKPPPLRTNFLDIADRDPCDLALHRCDFHTEAVSCIRDRKHASRVRLAHPLQPFSSPSL